MAAANDICILGDSVLLGVVFDEQKDKYSILRDGALTAFTRGLGMRVSNLAKMGQTSVQAEERFRSALDGGLQASAVLIELGGNDCDMDWAEVAEDPEGKHFPKVSIPAFRAAVESIISLALQKGIKPILASLPPLDPFKFLDWVAKDAASKMNVLRYLGDVGRIYRWQELYNLELARISSEKGLGLIRLREGFLDRKDYQDLICKDGIHPNSEGHAIMKEAICGYFTPKKISALGMMIA